MKLPSPCVIAMLLAGGLPAAAAEPMNSSSASAMASVREAEIGFAAAFADRDLEGFAAFIHPEAVFAGRDGPLVGREAVLSVWSRYFDTATAPFSWEPERVLVNAKGTLASTSGPVRDPEGRHVGAFASTWQKQADGSWQVVFDTSPSCPPPAAAGED